MKGANYPENRKKYNGIEFTNKLDLNTYDAQLRNLDPQIGRWNQIDPKIENMEAWSPYASNYDNPIRYNDFLGTLTFEVNSYIHDENDTGVPGVAGDKLTTTFSLTGNYDDEGKFSGFSASSQRVTGATFGVIQGEEGVDGKPNQDGYVKTLSDGTVVAGFEQHTEVNKLEAIGLKAMHGRIVDVAQNLTIKVGKDGAMSATIMHGTFPSVDVKMNGNTAYQFRQHSFLLSHSIYGGWYGAVGKTSAGQPHQQTSDAVNLINRSKQAPYINFGGFNAAPVNPSKYSKISW